MQHHWKQRQLPLPEIPDIISQSQMPQRPRLSAFLPRIDPVGQMWESEDGSRAPENWEVSAFIFRLGQCFKYRIECLEDWLAFGPVGVRDRFNLQQTGMRLKLLSAMIHPYYSFCIFPNFASTLKCRRIEEMLIYTCINLLSNRKWKPPHKFSVISPGEQAITIWEKSAVVVAATGRAGCEQRLLSLRREVVDKRNLGHTKDSRI